MPSKTRAVTSSKSTWAVIASIDSSMIIACTAGSSTRGARVATNASSSTSCTRAHAPTMDTGTRIAATTMQIADTTDRHRPPAGRSRAPDAVARRAFSASSSRTRSARICVADVPVPLSVMASFCRKGAPHDITRHG
jgi:hypothetical protein